VKDELAKNIWQLTEYTNNSLMTLARRELIHEDPLLDSLSSKQFIMVRAVKELNGIHPGGPSLKELAQNLGISEPSASVMVNNLVLKEILQRLTPACDRRGVRLQLTASAAKHFEIFNQALYRAIMSVTATGGPSLLLQWQSVLQQLQQALGSLVEDQDRRP
jgi:DNA-binding MarR family transcriptional regulator